MLTKPENQTDFNVGIIYWFYKELDVTKNHLELIRRSNPKAQIFGIFGGELSDAPQFQNLLAQLLDDFWVYPGTYGTDSYDKWIHGDLMLLDWYDKRGRQLSWDSLAITQWDMLVFDEIREILPGLKPEQVFFSGLRELDAHLEKRWSWTKETSPDRADYMAYRENIETNFGYRSTLKCCLYIFEILTRTFFDHYLNIPNKKLGMLEYKNPTYAEIFGIEIYQRDIGVYWDEPGQDVSKYPLNAVPIGIAKEYIELELQQADGWRIFHPVEYIWPI
ncbi:MAG: hypothetical protein ACHQUB_02900 [Candidatus Saccharimonadia bacterium]